MGLSAAAENHLTTLMQNSVNHRRRDHDIQRLYRVEDTDDEHLDGDAPGAHVIADGQTAE